MSPRTRARALDWLLGVAIALGYVYAVAVVLWFVWEASPKG